jgi:glucokinase
VTSRAFAPLRTTVIDTVRRARAAAPDVRHVGISTTGSVDASGIVLGAGFFEDYAQVSWKAVLDEAEPGANLAVSVTNDGRAAAWGTYLEDAVARGCSLAHFVVGTGIGGGVVVHDRLLHGAHNFAAVLGHLRVTDEATQPCVCGRQGCVELFAAAPALLRRARAAGVSAEATASVPALAAAARGGDAAAREAFRAAGAWLGRAVSLVANVLDPAVVTVGGGVLAAADDGDGGNWYVEGAAASAAALAHPRIAPRLQVVRASLLNDAALVGAAALAAGVRYTARP